MAENHDGKSFLQGEELRKAIGTIEFDLGLMAHGIDYLIDNGAPEDLIEKYNRSYDKALTRKAAELLHLEESDIADPATRTDEQKRLMLKIARAHQREQSRIYIQSDFVKTQLVIDNKALDILQGKKQGKSGKPEITEEEKRILMQAAPGLLEMINKMTEHISRPFPELSFDDLPGDEGTELQEALQILNLSFYATHPEFKPQEAGFIGEQEIALVQAATEAYLAFHQASGKPYSESIWEYFNPKERSLITEISQSDFFGLPVSKAWRKQTDIARSGAAGYDLNVGNKTKAGELFIEATISDKDGNPLKIDELEKQVQRAIGNLIDEARRLPIAVTPQQIYRAYARLPAEATVSEQQAAEMEAAMDKLITAPGTINYKKQLEQHKRIKQQADYDYSSPKAGYESGALITGSKKALQAHDGTWTKGYIIYEYPMYYKYSHVVGQIARVPNRFLLGAGKPATKADKTDGVRGTARSIAVKTEVLTRLLRMQERKENKKSFINIIRVDEVAADCGIALTAQTDRTLRKNIGLYLEELRKEGQLKKFEEAKEGRKIIGFKITL